MPNGTVTFTSSTDSTSATTGCFTYTGTAWSSCTPAFYIASPSIEMPPMKKMNCPACGSRAIRNAHGDDWTDDVVDHGPTVEDERSAEGKQAITVNKDDRCRSLHANGLIVRKRICAACFKPWYVVITPATELPVH